MLGGRDRAQAVGPIERVVGKAGPSPSPPTSRAAASRGVSTVRFAARRRAVYAMTSTQSASAPSRSSKCRAAATRSIVSCAIVSICSGVYATGRTNCRAESPMFRIARMLRLEEDDDDTIEDGHGVPGTRRNG